MKIKTLVPILAYFSFSIAVAQEERKWSLGLGFSPDLCYRVLKNDSGAAFIDDHIDFRNGIEKPKVGYTAGLYVRRRMSNVLYFETGVAYSNKGYSFEIDNISMTDQQGNILKTGRATVLYHFKYLDIPFKVDINLISLEKTSFHLTGGCTFNFFLEEKDVNWFTEGQKSEKTATRYSNEFSLNKPLNVSPFIGFGLNFKIRERLHLKVEPVFRYGILPVYDVHWVNTFLWSFGLNTVLYYRM